MTSLSILTIFQATNSTFGSTPQTPSNTFPCRQMHSHVTSCEYSIYASPEAHRPLYKVQYPRLASSHRKQGYSDISSALQFLPSFSFTDIANHSPLMRLTRRVPLAFLRCGHSALKACKKAFTTAPVFPWIPDTQITVETADALTCTRHCPFHSTSDGDLHPIAFHSDIFSPRTHYMSMTKSYSQFLKLSMNAILPEGLDFRSTFTDHQNLQYFSMTKILTRHSMLSETFPDSIS